MEDIQNAINSLEITLIRRGSEGLIEDVFSSKTLKAAIQSLEKQMPKKPIENGLLPNNRYKYLCPTCNRLYWDKEFLSDYCSSCGQKFDLTGIDIKGGGEG